MLDDRKTAILSAVVQEYITTAQPVGSSHIATRVGHRRVAGDRPQRDGGARAGGLPGPAPHVGRAHPDRQGLPLLRRPPRLTGHARYRGEPPDRRFLLRCPRQAGGDALPDIRPAHEADPQRSRGGRPEVGGRHDPQRPTRAAVLDGGDGGARARQRNGRERDRGDRRQAQRRHAQRRIRPTSRRVCRAPRWPVWTRSRPPSDTAVDALCATGGRRRPRRPPPTSTSTSAARRTMARRSTPSSRAAGAADAGAAVRGRLARARHRRPRHVRGDRGRARRRAARRRARSWWRRSSSTASASARSACSARPA